MNSNINYINNKPLRCVITNNLNSVKYFGSVNNNKEPYAGTLIIYEDPLHSEPELGYRKIYLNEKFLASGYGFETEELVEKIRKIAARYYQDIEDINDTENVHHDLVLDELDKKLDKEGPNADASNVYFLYQDPLKVHKLYIKDIIELLSKIPQYKDLEISSIKLSANYINYNQTHDNIENVDYQDIDEFTLPINVKLESIKGRIKIIANHTGGINKLSIIHKKHREDETLSTENYRINNFSSNENNTEYEIGFTIRFDTNDPYIIAEDNQIISKILLDVIGTPRSKYQTISIGKDEDIKNITYIANVIPNYQKEILFPNIKGDYYLTYSTSDNTQEDLILNSTNLFGSKQLVPILSNNDNKNKFTYIELPRNISKVVLLLPYKFTIRQALLVNGSDEISITNFLNYFEYSNNNFIQNNLKSNLYYINISNKLINSYTLKLDIIEDNTIGYNDMNIDSNNSISLINATKTYVLNSDEIHKYWINENNLPNVNNINNDLENGLEKIFNYNKL